MLGMTGLMAGRTGVVFRAASFAVAIAAFAAGGMRMAAADECKGPIRQCAIEIGATCEQTPKGQVIKYYDTSNHVASFEDCVGRLLEAAGRPNPYKTSPLQPPAKR